MKSPAGSCRIAAPELFSPHGEMNAFSLSPMHALSPDARDIERGEVNAMFYPVVD